MEEFFFLFYDLEFSDDIVCIIFKWKPLCDIHWVFLNEFIQKKSFSMKTTPDTVHSRHFEKQEKLQKYQSWKWTIFIFKSERDLSF
jgi:uncharacterized membrane protein YcgQ (UPF0703/DUF1980 family)